MKVTCKINNLKSVANKRLLERLKKYISMPDGEIDLEIGKEYNVYGVVFWGNCPFYYLCTETYDEYPKPFSSELFEVVDDQISSYWKFSVVDQGAGEVSTSLVFDEWAKDISFYERLVNDEVQAVKLFEHYRQLIDLE